MGSSTVTSPSNRPSVGMLSLATSMPDRILTNDYWRENHPEVVAEVEKRLWMWKPKDTDQGPAEFNEEMAPYVRDPFRGSRERRWIEADGSALKLETEAARRALAAAALAPEQIDLLICSSFVPDVDLYGYSVGGAAHLARELGLSSAGWNLETACSSMLVGFATACSLIRTGQHHRALVVTSNVYSRLSIPSDPISWGVGDAATAVVVGPVPADEGHLGSHSEHTGETCGTINTEIEFDEENKKPRFRLRAAKIAARVLRDIGPGCLHRCVGEAVRKARVELSDIDFFLFNAPLAWYTRFCARTLGVDLGKTISMYPLYSNLGPTLPVVGLLHAAQWGKIRQGDLVLLYSVGSVSSCAAVVMRWGDVALGPLPQDASPEKLEALEADARAPVAEP
ncbi:MAG: 3-oxoacyl-ACP synthase [bacterium]|nr:3-oxoacyl-ACP synthase [bacterium]